MMSARAIKTARKQRSARERMVESAAVLMREQGVKGTSFSQVLRHAGAPRGSIYHHFPGGKTQLIEEATRYAGDLIAAGLAAALREDDPIAGLEAMEVFWRSLLEQSEFAEGCPIVAAGLEGERTPEARDAAGQVFERWQGILVDSMVKRGISEERARSIAALCFAATEGGAIMARAQRSMEPLEGVFDELRRALVDALEDAGVS
jgi:TetR/AcrR family transcriptional regulator, lmrAB and yxaGH operons repressor